MEMFGSPLSDEIKVSRRRPERSGGRTPYVLRPYLLEPYLLYLIWGKELTGLPGKNLPVAGKNVPVDGKNVPVRAA